MTTLHELYREGLSLARELGRDVEEVPLPFQLNELEDYVRDRQAEVALRKRQAEVTPAKTDGPSNKR